jgi:hypothetical protein
MNPNFAKTFDIFFDQGYRAFTADMRSQEIRKVDIDNVLNHEARLSTHNFIFR